MEGSGELTMCNHFGVEIDEASTCGKVSRMKPDRHF